MLKKLISILLVFGILTSMSVAVSAATNVSITGWDANINGSGTIAVVSTTADGVPAGGSGYGLLHMFGGSSGNSNLIKTIPTTIGSTYHFTGRIWADRNRSNYQLYVTGHTPSPDRITNYGFTTMNAWNDFSFDFTATAAETTIQFRINGGSYNFYADNLSLKEVTGADTYGDELFTNGDFEAQFVAPDEAGYVYVASRNALNYIVARADSSTEVYQVEDGTETKLELDYITKTLGESTYTIYTHSGLTNGTTYNYKVKTVSQYGVTSEGKVVSGTPLETYDANTDIGNWVFKHNGDTYGIVNIEAGIGYDESAGMKVTNLNHSASNGIYIYIAPSSFVSLSENSVYKLTFKTKSEIRTANSGSYNIRFSKAYSSADGITFNSSVNTAIKFDGGNSDGGWNEHVMYLKGSETAANDIQIQIARNFENLVFDDFELYEVNATTLEKVDGAVNLIGNGDFEGLFAAPDEAGYVYVASRNALNYIVARADSPTEVYLVENGTETKLELDSITKTLGENTYTIYTHSGLTNGTTYNYKVKTVSQYGATSEGVAASGTPLETYDANTDIGNWVFKHNGDTYGIVNIEDGIGYDESAGMKVTNLNHSASNGIYIYIAPSSFVNLSENSVYKLTFKTKSEIRTANSGSYNIRFSKAYSSADGITFNSSVNTAIKFDGGNSDGGWNEHVMYLKGSETAANDIQIQIVRNFENLVFDDFELYEVNATTLEKVDGAVNLITDGDFEAAYVAPAEAEQVYVAPRNGVNYIVVKTQAPGVQIYQVADNGAETKLDLEVQYDSGMSAVAYAHTGLTNNKAYKYLIKTVGINGMASEGITAIGVPSEAYDNVITTNGWNTKYNPGTLENYGLVAIEDGVGVDSSAGMRISNLVNKTSYNAYIQISANNPVTLEVDKVYKLTFKAKTKERNADSSVFNIRMNNATVSLDGLEYSNNARPLTCEDDGTWKEQICYFKATESENILELRAMRYLENLVLDNLELYEVDENLAVVEGAVNLIVNGDFEAKEEPSFKTELKFYAASSAEDTFGEILDDGEIMYLGDLKADFDTDVVYAQASIKNEIYTSGKPFTFIFATYKDNALYDVRFINGTATYLPGGSQGETVGIAYRLPDMSDGIYGVKTFVWDSFTGMSPLATECGNVTE